MEIANSVNNMTTESRNKTMSDGPMCGSKNTERTDCGMAGNRTIIVCLFNDAAIRGSPRWRPGHRLMITRKRIIFPTGIPARDDHFFQDRKFREGTPAKYREQIVTLKKSSA